MAGFIAGRLGVWVFLALLHFGAMTGAGHSAAIHPEPGALPAAREQDDARRGASAGDLVAQAPVDPCRDGRISDGRPRSCEELLHWLENGEDHESWDRLPYRPVVPHPCTDGRLSDGRPRSCAEIMRWLRQNS